MEIEETVREGMYMVERPTGHHYVVLFIHGLGESSLCWTEAFPQLSSDWHLLAIDLPGYGRSPRGSFDGTIHGYVDCLDNLINTYFGSQRIIVVGHSFGGDIGNLLSNRSLRVAAFASVEGDLTPHDLFISRRAVHAPSFSAWFQEFKEEMYRMGRESVAFRRYFVSLSLANPRIFINSARSLMEAVERLGPAFLNIRCPKRFFWGRKSLARETRDFVGRHNIPNEAFDSGHWVMVDQPEIFYGKLRAFILASIGAGDYR